MNNTHISIDRLAIRTQGLSASLAQTAVNGLGQQVLTQLTHPSHRLQPGRTMQIGNLDLGKIQVTNPRDATAVRRAIAQAVTTAISSKLSDRACKLHTRL